MAIAGVSPRRRLPLPDGLEFDALSRSQVVHDSRHRRSQPGPERHRPVLQRGLPVQHRDHVRPGQHQHHGQPRARALAADLPEDLPPPVRAHLGRYDRRPGGSRFDGQVCCPRPRRPGRGVHPPLPVRGHLPAARPAPGRCRHVSAPGARPNRLRQHRQGDGSWRQAGRIFHRPGRGTPRQAGGRSGQPAGQHRGRWRIPARTGADFLPAPADERRR